MIKSILKLCHLTWRALFVSVVFLSACKSTLELKSVDYSTLIETVMVSDSNGIISDRSYGLRFSVKPIQYLETGDSSRVNSEFRVIRDLNGYYFITSAGFKHVYIMRPTANAMKLYKQVMVSQGGLQRPAFNQRNPIIQLIDGDSRMYMLNKDGLLKDQ